MPASLVDELAVSRVGINGKITLEEVRALLLEPIVYQFSSQFLLDPGEYNSWGLQGVSDNINSQDLGNVGTANLNRNAGGLSFPFDVRLKRFTAHHRVSNGLAEPWGWFIARVLKTPPGNGISTTWMLDESFDRGPGTNLRDYGNNQNQYSDLTTFDNDVIPAGEILVVGVGAPTAIGTDYYVQVSSGYLEFERVY